MITLLIITFATIGAVVAFCMNKKMALPIVSAPSSLPPSTSSSSFDSAKQKAPSHRTTEFALDLLRAASGPAANFVLSPFSLGSSLAMLHDGAGGATQKELTTLLGKTLSPGEVSMMYSTLETSHAIMNSSVQIRSANKMFIDKDPAYSLLLLMPKRGDFGQWRDKMTAERLHGAIARLRSGNINLNLPKFVTVSTMNGKSALQKLGVQRVFERNADLTSITEKQDLYVSALIHKAVFRVSEQGTEAAGATTCEFITFGISDSPTVSFDKPFIYGIVRDDRDILFLGQMVYA